MALLPFSMGFDSFATSLTETEKVNLHACAVCIMYLFWNVPLEI